MEVAGQAPRDLWDNQGPALTKPLLFPSLASVSLSVKWKQSHPLRDERVNSLTQRPGPHHLHHELWEDGGVGGWGGLRYLLLGNCVQDREVPAIRLLDGDKCSINNIVVDDAAVAN